MSDGFALFDTAIGLCGVAWNARGLAGVMLPLSEGGDPRGRMTRRHPEADEGEPPPAVAEAIAGMQAVLRGEKRDLLEVALDDGAIAPLAKRVYAIARAIPGARLVLFDGMGHELPEPLWDDIIGELKSNFSA